MTCAPGASRSARTNGSRAAVQVMTTSAPSTASSTLATALTAHDSTTCERRSSAQASRTIGVAAPHADLCEPLANVPERVDLVPRLRAGPDHRHHLDAFGRQVARRDPARRAGPQVGDEPAVQQERRRRTVRGVEHHHEAVDRGGVERRRSRSPPSPRSTAGRAGVRPSRGSRPWTPGHRGGSPTAAPPHRWSRPRTRARTRRCTRPCRAPRGRRPRAGSGRFDPWWSKPIGTRRSSPARAVLGSRDPVPQEAP